MRLALFEPDIPPNAGTLIRLGACLGAPVDIIEPCGFAWSDKTLRRAGLDYFTIAEVTRHLSWPDFVEARAAGSRIILLTTKTNLAYTDFAFRPDDILLVGRESKGAPAEVHEGVDARITVPMVEQARSLNVAVAAAMVLGEALRQVRAT
ncbi:MAG: tRNA (cytidine(34)-2'-O)-methyltransferase [Sphingomonadales bacterium]